MHILAFRLPSACADVGVTLFRIALGAIFMWHGYDKFERGIPAITGFMTSLGLPFPQLMAYLLTYGELIGGLLLILGALTVWVSAMHLVIAIVAFFTVHMSKGFSVSDGGYEFIMLLGAGALYFLTNGPGRYAVDAFFSRKNDTSVM